MPVVAASSAGPPFDATGAQLEPGSHSSGVARLVTTRSSRPAGGVASMVALDALVAREWRRPLLELDPCEQPEVRSSRVRSSLRRGAAALKPGAAARPSSSEGRRRLGSPPLRARDRLVLLALFFLSFFATGIGTLGSYTGEARNKGVPLGRRRVNTSNDIVAALLCGSLSSQEVRSSRPIWSAPRRAALRAYDAP